MDNQIVEEVTEWESRPFSGGHTGLRELADEEFTGAVTNGTAWLFLLNGRVVAAVDGSMGAFETADGTAYEAPHPSVPLLFAMQERGGETKAKYYTEETPLSDVNETLSAGNFTGYVELSENVLSGDYYVVYHGGRSLACAFIGNNRTLLTGDEALERADDEVGIYEVYDVDVDVIPIPDGAGNATATAGGQQEESAETDDAISGADDTVAGVDGVADIDPDDSESETNDGIDEHVSDELDGVGITGTRAGTTDDSPETDAETVDDPVEDAPGRDDHGVGTDASTDEETTDAAEAGSTEEAVDGDAEPTATESEGQPARPADEQPSTDADSTATAADSISTTAEAGGRDDDPDSEVAGTGEGVETGEQTAAESGDAESEDPFSEEAQWRETQSIPSLDPSKSETLAAEPATERDAEPAPDEATARTSQPSRSETTPEQTGTAESVASETAVDDREIVQLRDRLRELEAAKEEAEAAKERLAAEREELETERDEYRRRAQQLESRVEELESEVERLESALEDANGADDGRATRTMPAAEALSGTNLFVRYDTKGGATLEKGHAGDVDRGAVVENLSLEHHTSFDSDGLQVAGEPFETFLENTVEYRFVRWVVEDLLYEIRDTGHEAQLGELFDSIPEVDRAELDGTVSVEFQENGETHREQEQFDVVLRDRMGNPLIVANLNSARDPASGEMMTDLIERARRVKDTSDTLGSAFLVTTSYFQPDALETADDATGGGLLGRGKRKSFVKLSRKRGFHLCLVETRDGNFHVNVPEL